MFFVFSKDKIISYMVSFATVIILLGIAFYIRNDSGTLQVNSAAKNLPVYSVKTEENKISLTMNCAWNADDIDKILEVLNKTNTKITFFLVGDWVDKYPEAVKKINEEGHEIGNHSNTHPHVNNLSYEENVSQIKECSDKIEKITKQKTTLYRGPYGEYNDTVFKASTSLNNIMIQWNIDTLDYNGLTGEEMWNRINKNLCNGSIILTHNGTAHTADSLEYLITNIKSAGYEIVPVSELIYKSDYHIDNTGMQIKN